MKNLDWEKLLVNHSLFSNLGFEERKKVIRRLLEDEISEERQFPSGSIILKEGEFGESIFLIGSGSARVVIKVERGEESTDLSIMKKGDFFGEIALFQQKPRSATVVANQECTLLEIKGQEILNLLEKHPDIEIKFLFKLSERLRYTHDQVLGSKLKNIDNRLSLFRAKLDAEIRVMDSELRACQTVFDQTKLRTDEVINSAERSRTRLTISASVIGTFVSIIIAIFGIFGFKQLLNIETLSKTVETQVKTIETHMLSIEESRKSADSMSTDLRTRTDGIYDSINELENYVTEKVHIPKIRRAIEQKDINTAISLYTQLKERRPDAHTYIEDIRVYVVQEIISNKAGEPGDYTELLQYIREVAPDPKQQLLCYYVFMANAILVDKESYSSNFDDFVHFTRDYKGRELSKEDFEIFELNQFFKNQTQMRRALFDRIESQMPIG